MQERNPSSSPPPSPPKPEFMREGLDGDDIWVMVEDEFLSTARLFTQHLHHAEYQRLKKLARVQNESKIQSIARPVDNRSAVSSETKKKVEGRWLKFKQTEDLDGISSDVGGSDSRQDDDDQNENDPFLQNPRLAGLMTQKAGSRKLSAVIGTKPRTLPTAPSLQEPTTLDKSTRRALGADRARKEGAPHPGSAVTPRGTNAATTTAQSARVDTGGLSASSSSSRALKLSAVGSVHTKRHPEKYLWPNAMSFRKQAPTQFDPLSEPTKSAEQTPAVSSGFSERMARRRAEARNKEEANRRKSVLLDDIPTFLV